LDPWLLSGLLGLAAACVGPPSPRETGLADSGRPDSATPADEDGDGVSDAHEGRAQGWDTDGDGVPDYRDGDSDGDGVRDREEAGDGRLATAPVDSDDDGVPDVRDRDSDDNGVGDGDELRADTDDDGQVDRVDPDDDGDRVADRRELEDVDHDRSADADGDGLPNYRDPDSDDDGIADGDERDLDTDGDGLADWADLDSDADGLADADEAGDADPQTPPVDTDGDGRADFRDTDSDGDGLSDSDEAGRGTSPRDADTDGDGVDDLVEVGAGTDPLDPGSDPRSRGDFVFVVPYEAPPEPARDTLAFRTDIQYADVYFLVDTTGSMRSEISTMRDTLVGIVDGVTCARSSRPCERDAQCRADEVCGPSGACIADSTNSACVANLWSGVGVFAGEPHSYRNVLSIQPDAWRTREALPGRADGSGANESLFQSVACVANPGFCLGAMCDSAGRGCPGFREQAVPIAVTVTDEGNECSGCAPGTGVAAGRQLRDAGITFVGIDADTYHEPQADLTQLAMGADSSGPGGEPLVFAGSEGAVAHAVTDAIDRVVDEVPLRVTVDVTDGAGDAGDASWFVERLEVQTAAAGCSAVQTADGNGDGVDDYYPAVAPGTHVCWEVVVRPNEVLEPADEPQVLVAELTVRGDGSPLDERRVFFVVPPRVAPPGLQ
jgi:hypothetical protein